MCGCNKYIIECHISCIFTTIANCGHPELLCIQTANNSQTVPAIEGYDGLPVEGSAIRFRCPPGLELIGLGGSSTLAICTESGEWDPDPSGLMCNGKEY